MPHVDIICLSGTTPGLAAMDKNGEALYPAILMLDQRSRKQAQIIIDTIGMKDLLEIQRDVLSATQAQKSVAVHVIRDISSIL